MHKTGNKRLDYGDDSDDDANPGIFFFKKECLPLSDRPMGNRTNFASKWISNW